MAGKPFTLIVVVLFAVMALLHLYRLFTHFQIVLGTHVIPMWVSYIGIVVAGGLAILVYRESLASRR